MNAFVFTASSSDSYSPSWSGHSPTWQPPWWCCPSPSESNCPPPSNHHPTSLQQPLPTLLSPLASVGPRGLEILKERFFWDTLYFVAISLFFTMKGQVGCSSTILGLGSLPVARVVAEHAMDIAAVNISTCSFTLILMLIWMSQCFVKMNISTIFTWHPEIEELPRRALYATKNRLWLNKAFLPPWMFTAQRLVDDYLRDIVWGFKLIG